MKAFRKGKRNKIQIQDILIIVAMAAVTSLSEQVPLLRHRIKRLHERTQAERNNPLLRLSC